MPTLLFLVACNDFKVTTVPAGVAYLPKKRVFITGGYYTGAAVGGLAGADAKCQSRANAAGLGGSWRAWLSDSTTDAKNRINDVSPWYLVDGTTLVAATFADLTSNELYIEIDENGDPFPEFAWTGTNANGTKQSLGASYCGNWTTTVGFALLGASVGIGGLNWSASDPGPCVGDAALYCFEQ